MNKNNNIILISDDEKLSKMLSSKLILLRETDSIVLSDYRTSLINIKANGSKIVILHENLSKNITLSIIDEIKNDEDNKDLSIILLIDSYDPELILTAYDAGITDFCSSSAADFELVIRAVNNIKMASVRLKSSRNIRLLAELNVIDEMTGFYTYNYAKHVIENEINDGITYDGTFMAVAPSEDSKTKFSLEKMGQAIARSVRSDDIVAFGKGAKFYIMLPKTDLNGASSVLNKIKLLYGEDFTLKAGICNISDDFEEMEHNVLKALSDAMYSEDEYSMVEKREDTLDDWLETGSEQKNYKLFKQIFSKKMEKIIAPVFFRLQKSYEEKLFNTKIDQYTDEDQCVFHLKNKKQDSKLTICYPGFAKIVIYISHDGLDSPENREITLPLTKITQKELIKIVEDFIKEFKLTSV